jgi:hypothetical protein
MERFWSEEDDRQMQQYEDHDCWTLLAALERIDRARTQLIQAQNNLVGLLRQMPVGMYEFGYFYERGGCTAQDWRAWLNNEFRPASIITRAQLRLVVSTPDFAPPPL